MIFTKANADTNGRIVNELIDKYTAQNSERACAFMSLGQKRYFSALKYYFPMLPGDKSQPLYFHQLSMS